MNKNLFHTTPNPVTHATARNNAGGKAYRMTDRHALAQLALTGTFNNTFYVQGKVQLEQVLELCNKVPARFVAQLAVYSRQKGYMKDMPVLLLAYLSTVDSDLFASVFDKIINNGKQLRNFVQVMRSGVVGRKSLGSRPKKMVQNWFASRTSEKLFFNSMGNNPSMADVIKMMHPHPESQEKEATFGYILGRDEINHEALPDVIQNYHTFLNKKAGRRKLPKAPFEMLSSAGLSTSEWAQLAEQMTWQQLRQNLNTLQRHGVLNDNKIIQQLAKKLSDRHAILASNVFPTQLLAAYLHAGGKMSQSRYSYWSHIKSTTPLPAALLNALQNALDISLENVPACNGKMVIFVDVSGSMHSPITGTSKTTSKIACVDAAALFASALLKKSSENTVVVPFDTKLHKACLNPRDSIMTNASKLSKFGGGGTNCSLGMKWLNTQKEHVDVVVYLSDYESWADYHNTGYRGAPLAALWKTYRKTVNSDAKLVCVDLQPHTTLQAHNDSHVLNIGGWSDQMFKIIVDFVNSDFNPQQWIEAIETELV